MCRMRSRHLGQTGMVGSGVCLELCEVQTRVPRLEAEDRAGSAGTLLLDPWRRRKRYRGVTVRVDRQRAVPKRKDIGLCTPPITRTMQSSTRQRPSHSPSASMLAISSPTDFDRPSSQATVISVPSSPSYPSSPGAKRPSLTTTMHWLSRSTNAVPTSSSPPHASPKPVRISEPKYTRGMDARTGVLGAGAIVVRTPNEALRDMASRSTSPLKHSDDGPQRSSSLKKKKKSSISRTVIPPTLESVGETFSPPLPPLPLPESDEEAILSRTSSESSKPRTPRLPAAVPASMSTPGSVPVPVPVPRSPSLRPSLKIRSVPNSEDRDIVPPLPSSVPPSPPPPFKPILVSELPAFPVDASKVIVTLETCTQTHRTTLETINSRPSHLSKYVNSLIARQRSLDSTRSSVYSTLDEESSSDDLAVYRRHLASQGLLPQTSYNLHFFLDRPSAPYTHILTYLRSSPPTPDYPEAIPRALLHLSSQDARLESLIELRDEAAYLNLDNLHRMCVDEIARMRLHACKTHARSGPSASSIQSLRASVYNLHTLLERVETDNRSSAASFTAPELLRQGSSSSSRDNAMSDPAPGFAHQLPPTPPSWSGPGHRRNLSVPRPMKPAPAGWI